MNGLERISCMAPSEKTFQEKKYRYALGKVKKNRYPNAAAHGAARASGIRSCPARLFSIFQRGFVLKRLSESFATREVVWE
jgi:hypothetical protein